MLSSPIFGVQRIVLYIQLYKCMVDAEGTISNITRSNMFCLIVVMYATEINLKSLSKENEGYF